MLRRHSVSVVAAQTTRPPSLSGFFLGSDFRWRRFSIAKRITPNLFVDDVDRCTPELPMQPEDMYIRPQRTTLGGSTVDVDSIEGCRT